MDLKTGRLFWPDLTADTPKFEPLDRDLRCDIAVIGGGITGALAAYHLCDAGAAVVVVDRRQICAGSTPASTGLLQYEIDTPLVRLIDLIGPDRARRAYRACVDVLDDMQTLVRRLDDDCALAARQSLYLAHESGDVAELRREHDERRRIGIEVELLESDSLHRQYGIDRPAALRSFKAMEVDPYRLSLALIRDVVSRGTRVFADTTIDGYETTDNGVTLRSARGSIRAGKVVFATGYETPQFLDQDICQLRSTYALVSQPLVKLDEAWPRRCLIWESGDPYFYARTTLDNRAMIGGEDIDSADPEKRDRLIDEKADRLVEKFGELLPGLRVEPQYRWAGTFAQTRDGLPYIGTTPQFPHGYFALGYGGNGITFSLIAAQVIGDAFMGRTSANAELFRFGR